MIGFPSGLRAVPARCLAAAWQPGPGPGGCSSCLPPGHAWPPWLCLFVLQGQARKRCSLCFAPWERCINGEIGRRSCSDPLGTPHAHISCILNVSWPQPFPCVQCQLPPKAFISTAAEPVSRSAPPSPTAERAHQLLSSS